MLGDAKAIKGENGPMDRQDFQGNRNWAFLKYALLAIIALVTGFLVMRWQQGTMDYRFYTEEWGPLELLHSLLTALCGWMFYLAWRDGRGAVSVAGGALALLAAAAFVRELDVKKVAAHTGPEWLYFLADHGLQDALLIAMTLPIFVYFYIKRAQMLDVVKLAMRWQAWPLALAGVLILLSVYLDERVVSNDRERFWEELAETYGYGFMTLAAWKHWLLVGAETLDHGS